MEEDIAVKPPQSKELSVGPFKKIPLCGYSQHTCDRIDFCHFKIFISTYFVTPHGKNNSNKYKYKNKINSNWNQSWLN